MKICLVAISVVLCCLLGMVVPVSGDNRAESSKSVVPASELKIAQDLEADGPTETIGIESSKVLGTISLAGEFAGTENHMLRVREVTVLPGGQVAVHQHNSRPGAAYILEGELVEHRNDSESPITRATGSVALEKTGTIHWWKNESTAKAKVLVVDIVSNDTK
jgi:quercetin dioxygenase-like cupin family protein